MPLPEQQAGEVPVEPVMRGLQAAAAILQQASMWARYRTVWPSAKERVEEQFPEVAAAMEAGAGCSLERLQLAHTVAKELQVSA